MATQPPGRPRRRWGMTMVMAVILVGGGIALTYHHVLTADRDELAGGYDVFRAVGPLAYFMDYSIHHGTFPLWNPLTFTGMPYVANPITSAFYPGNILRSLLTFDPTPLKSQTGMVILQGIHLLIMGVGMVFLARSHKLSHAAALAAAFAFIFSAIWIRRASEYHFLTTMGWLPWILLITHFVLAGDNTLRSKLRGAAGCGILVGIGVLSGTLNIAAYLAVTVGSYAVLFRLLHPRPRNTAPEVSNAKVIGGDIIFFGVMFIIAVSIGMALLLPGQEFANLSSRVKDSELTLASPKYHGSWQDLFHTLLRYPGLKWEVENIRGIGVVGLLLAIAGLTYRRRKDVAIFVVLFAILFDCSMGKPWPIATLIETFSPIQMIASTRAFDFAVLPLAMLAGMGVDAVANRDQRWWLRILRMFILLGLGYVFLETLDSLLGPDTFLAMDRIALLPAFIALGVVIIASWFPPAPLWKAVLVCLLLGETLLWNQRYIPHIILIPGFARSAGQFDGSNEFWADNKRGTDNYQNRHLYALRPAMHGYEPVHLADVREVLASDGRGATYQRSVKGYEITQENHRGNLFLKRSLWLARQYVSGPLRNKHSLFPATTTVYLPDVHGLPLPEVSENEVPPLAVSDQARRVDIVQPAELEEMKTRLLSGAKRRSISIPAFDMPGVHSALCLKFRPGTPVSVVSIFRDPSTGRREYGKIARIARRSELMLQLPLPDFDRMEVTINFDLQDAASSIELTDVYLMADEADENHLINIVERTANAIDVQIGALPDYRILTFLDPYYPGWHAYVDGARVPILRANDVYKAIVLPPGEHRAQFRYEPVRVYVGVTISLCGAAIAVAMIVALRRRRDRTAPVVTEPVVGESEGAEQTGIV